MLLHIRSKACVELNGQWNVGPTGIICLAVISLSISVCYCTINVACRMLG